MNYTIVKIDNGFVIHSDTNRAVYSPSIEDALRSVYRLEKLLDKNLRRTTRDKDNQKVIATHQHEINFTITSYPANQEELSEFHGKGE